MPTLRRSLLMSVALAVATAGAACSDSVADGRRPGKHAKAKAPSAGRRAKPSDAQLRAELTAMQYQVTQEDGTEPPFDNAYWDNHAAGIYVDIVTGEPLFSSQDKFDSGTGWPSFVRPIAPDVLKEAGDDSAGMTRTEVRSKVADSHLGHVFDDGPEPTGLRYCIDSAALRFVPAAELAAAGYPEYQARFARR